MTDTKNSVVAVVFSEDKHSIVALKRCDVPIWVLPAGGIEFGESPEEAVVREVLEETGLHVSVTRKIGEYTPVNRLTNFTHLFECRISQGSLKTGEETRDIGIFECQKLPYPFLHVHQQWIKDARLQSTDLIKGPVQGASWFHFARYLFTHPILMFRYILTLCGLTINTPADK